MSFGTLPSPMPEAVNAIVQLSSLVTKVCQLAAESSWLAEDLMSGR
jgi:hypothetical protein